MGNQLLMPEAKSELKILEGEINRSLSSVQFIGNMRENDGMIHGMTTEAFGEQANAALQKINSLIRRHQDIEHAIALADGRNEITLSDGRTLTRAEAIGLRDRMKVGNSKGKMDDDNPDMEAALLKRLNVLYLFRKCCEDKSAGEEKEKQIEELERVYKRLLRGNRDKEPELDQREQKLIQEQEACMRVTVYDPNHIMDWVKERERKRQELLEELDAAITRSDTETYIELENG